MGNCSFWLPYSVQPLSLSSQVNLSTSPHMFWSLSIRVPNWSSQPFSILTPRLCSVFGTGAGRGWRYQDCGRHRQSLILANWHFHPVSPLTIILEEGISWIETPRSFLKNNNSYQLQGWTSVFEFLSYTVVPFSPLKNDTVS